MSETEDRTSDDQDRAAEELSMPDGDGSALIDAISTLPRVGEIGVQTRIMRAETAAPAKETSKANVSWRLKPFVPRVKKQMVTMSDLGMTGQVGGTAQPARRKRRRAPVPKSGDQG